MKLTQRRSTYSRNSLYRTRKIWTSSRPQTIIKGGECIYRTQIYRISCYTEQTASPEASTIVVYMECRGHRWSAAIITHTRLTALCPGITRASRYQKGKTNLDFTEARDSGISWAVCKSAPRSRQITIPAPHHSVFYRPDALTAAQPTASKHWRHLPSLSGDKPTTSHRRCHLSQATPPILKSKWTI